MSKPDVEVMARVKTAILNDVQTIRFDEAARLSDRLSPDEIDLLAERAAWAALRASNTGRSEAEAMREALEAADVVIHALCTRRPRPQHLADALNGWAQAKARTALSQPAKGE